MNCIADNGDEQSIGKDVCFTRVLIHTYMLIRVHCWQRANHLSPGRSTLNYILISINYWKISATYFRNQADFPSLLILVSEVVSFLPAQNIRKYRSVRWNLRAMQSAEIELFHECQMQFHLFINNWTEGKSVDDIRINLPVKWKFMTISYHPHSFNFSLFLSRLSVRKLWLRMSFLLRTYANTYTHTLTSKSSINYALRTEDRHETSPVVDHSTVKRMPQCKKKKKRTLK